MLNFVPKEVGSDPYEFDPDIGREELVTKILRDCFRPFLASTICIRKPTGKLVNNFRRAVVSPAVDCKTNIAPLLIRVRVHSAMFRNVSWILTTANGTH